MADGVTSEFMRDFNSRKTTIEGYISTIDECTGEIKTCTSQAASAFDPNEEKSLSARVDRCVKSGRDSCAACKSALDEMKQRGEALERSGGNTGELEIMKMHFMRLLSAFVASAKEHQRAKTLYSDTVKSLMLRRAKVLFPDTPEGDLQRRIEENPTGLIKEAFSTRRANDRARAAYDEAEARAAEVMKLAASVTELHNMMADLNTLVNQQSEMLDNVIVHFDRATDHVHKGNDELRKANRYQRKARKKWCCIAIIFVVILVALSGVLGTFLGTA